MTPNSNMKLDKQKNAVLKLNWDFRSKLWAEGSKLRAEGDKLYAQGNKLYAEGNKLWAEGSKLRAEGDKLWAETILATFGDVMLEWKSDEECIVDKKYIFKKECTTPPTPTAT